MDLRTTLRLAVCALAFAALPAAAALYKWTDENGRVVYGDTPPPGVKAARVNAMVAPGDPNAVHDMAAKDAQVKKWQMDRADAQARSEKAETDARAKLDHCAQLRGQLQTLRGTTAVYKFDDKGNKVFYDAAERTQSIADTEKQLRDLDCPSAPG